MVGFSDAGIAVQHGSCHFLTGFGRLTGHAFIAGQRTGWVKNAVLKLFVLRGGLSRLSPDRLFPIAAQNYCFADKTRRLNCVAAHKS